MSSFEDINSSNGVSRFFRRDNIILVFGSLVAITLFVVIATILTFSYKIKTRDIIII